MYEVKLINDGIETIINAVSTHEKAPRITGSIKLGINVIDSFSFVILPNNPGYTNINPLKTLVEVYGVNTNTLIFSGRALLSVPSMDSLGNLAIKVICESEFGYLEDSKQKYGEYHNISVRDFLKVILDRHNSMVEAEKHFKLGIVEVVDKNDSLYRYLGDETTFATIKDKLIDRLGGELKIRYENGYRYLDYLNSIGSKKQTEIRLAKNLKTIEQEKDPTQIISRLTPYGSKLEESEQRLTIESVNGGVEYIDDLEAIKQFGVICGSVNYDDVTQASNLLKKGQEYLAANNRIKKKHKLDALDLSLIGLDIDSFEVGNIYPVINPIMAIDEDMRIIEKTISIENPQNSTLTIGDKFEDIKEYQSNISKTQTNLYNLTQQVSSVAGGVIDVNGSLQQTNENLMNTTNGLQQTNESLINTNNVLINTNTKLEKLRKMIIMGV